MSILNGAVYSGYRVRTVQRNTTNAGDLLIYDGDFTPEAAEKLVGAFVTIGEVVPTANKFFAFLKDGYALTYYESEGGITTGNYSSLCQEDFTAGTLTYALAFSAHDARYNDVPTTIDIIEKV